MALCLVLAAACTDLENPAPVITGVTPEIVPVHVDTTVTVQGQRVSWPALRTCETIVTHKEHIGLCRALAAGGISWRDARLTFPPDGPTEDSLAHGRSVAHSKQQHHRHANSSPRRVTC